MRCRRAYLTIKYLSFIVVCLSAYIPNIALCYDGLKATGCYSNLYYNDEGGDLLGYEFCIVNSNKGHHVLYQESSGWPDVPLLLPVIIENNKISFTVSLDDKFPGKFNGMITNHRLKGKFSNSEEYITLKRKSSYWIRNNKYLTVEGCYSNMHYVNGRGIIGYEFFIVLGKDNSYILYQESSGEPAMPLLLPIIKKDYSISFTLPQGDSHHGQFNGTITANGLTGNFSSNDEQIVLKRKYSYWQ
ncbi:MAG: hypothetical protein LBI12_02630 [Treponema sp.]|nr:hypothetical protein [Treponema sp.]